MCYAQDFLETWLGCDLIIGSSSGVPIKRGAVKATSAATPVGKGKEKRIKQEKVKQSEPEEDVEGTEADLEAKKRKTAKSQKQLVIFEEPEGVSSPTVGKEIGHPKTQVKTKVESSLSQVPMSSLAQGSLGSFDLVPQSPLGPFRRTCIKRKIIGDSVERERRARPLSFFSLLFCSSLSLLLQCFSFSLLTDE